ncbi:MAG: ABC transporter substrate-binding protein [Acidimicrobiia bacterium]
MEAGSGRRSLAVALLALTALVACGADDDAGPSPADGGSSSTSSSTTTTTAPDEGFPVTVTGANGEVAIAARPERIVVLSPSLTESVFAVGAGDQVVAVDADSDHPAGAPVTDLSSFRPNVEAIGRLEPDLVLVARDRDDLVATLATVGIPALVLPSARDLDQVYAQIEVIGAATGHRSAAEDLAASMREEVDAQLARVPASVAGDTYFYEVSADLHTATSDTFVGSILDHVGLVSIAEGVDPAAGAFPQLNAERVLEADPDHIFLAHADGSVPAPAEVAARPGWATLGAVAGGRITALDTDVASRWGPRVVELVTALADALAGDEGR